MAKAIKPYSSRTPPVPSTSHTEIDEWMQRLVPHLHPIVQALDELIRGTIRGVQYAIKWKKAYYGTPKLGWVIEIVAYDISVNVVFLGGADFDPPPPLGTVDRSRYIKVDDPRGCTGAGHAQVDQSGWPRCGLAMSLTLGSSRASSPWLECVTA